MSINDSDSGITHWTDTLFVNHPYLYYPLLEHLKKDAPQEVDGLCKLFDEFKVGEGSKILDFSCGIGRHSIPLAKKGYDIVGYDPSQFFLEKAMLYYEQEFVRGEKKVRFYRGDVRNFNNVLSTNNDSNFNAIIIMFNSFGFFDEVEDTKILKQLLSVAEPGCILVIETENRDWSIMNTPHHYIWEFGGVLSNEIWEFNQHTSTLESKSKLYKKDSENEIYRLQLEFQMKLRLYSLHELMRLLKNAGWAFRQCYGNIKTLEDVSLKSQYMITVSKKM